MMYALSLIHISLPGAYHFGAIDICYLQSPDAPPETTPFPERNNLSLYARFERSKEPDVYKRQIVDRSETALFITSLAAPSSRRSTLARTRVRYLLCCCLLYTSRCV